MKSTILVSESSSSRSGGHQLGHHPHRRDLVFTHVARQPVDRPCQVLGANPGTPFGERAKHLLKLDHSVLDTHTRY